MFIPDPRIQPPGILRGLYPDAVWRFTPDKPEVYLTFDDGPVPEATPWILDALERENCKATFFCVGDNAERYPAIYRDLLAAGHRTGNHTHNHLQGLKTTSGNYIRNIEKAARVIRSQLFRPPHGLMSLRQYRYLAQRYRIIMWDIVAMDYHPSYNPDRIWRSVSGYVRNGSVITFHDSVKTIEKLKIALPPVIKMLKDRGFQPVTIPDFRSDGILLP